MENLREGCLFNPGRTGVDYDKTFCDVARQRMLYGVASRLALLYCLLSSYMIITAD
jgi:hypothetical protein